MRNKTQGLADGWLRGDAVGWQHVRVIRVCRALLGPASAGYGWQRTLAMPTLSGVWLLLPQLPVTLLAVLDNCGVFNT